jgi:hypothetical protein
MKLVTLEASVHFKQEGDVTLTVVIGEAQIGGGVIKIDDKQVGVAPIENLPLGSGSELKGKKLLIKTIVSDENPQTNKTSVTYLFDQTGEKQSFVSSAEVEHDKDVIGYWAKFKLS